MDRTIEFNMMELSKFCPNSIDIISLILQRKMLK